MEKNLIIEDIQNGKTVSRRVKQALFGIPILAHAAEKVEMILRKIGKYDGVVHNGAFLFKRKRMRGNFHHHHFRRQTRHVGKKGK